MSELKKAVPFLAASKMILVVLIAVIIIVLPQLNIQKYVFGTITSKLIYLLYGCMILLVLYTVHLVFSKVISFSKIDLALIVLLFYMSLNRYYIHADHGFSIRYIELLALAFLYAVLRCISLKNFPWLALSIVVSAIIQAVYGNLQLLGIYPSNHPGFKMTGSFFNPGPYAGFLAIVWTISLGMYLWREHITTQLQTPITNKAVFFSKFENYIFEYIPLLGLISIAIVLPALQSRASWIVVLASSCILMELKYHFLQNTFTKASKGFQKTVVLLICFGILSCGVFGLYHYKKASSDGRAFIWKVTTTIISENPVYGVGFDQFKAHYMNHQAAYFAKYGQTHEILLADNTFYAFNEWLQFLAENGLLGVLLLMVLVFILIRAKAKTTHISHALILKTVLLMIGIFACFSYPMQILPIKMVLVLVMAMLSNMALSGFQIKIKDGTKTYWRYKLGVLLLAFFALLQSFIYTSSLSNGFIAWNNALIVYRSGDYRGAIQEFELAYPVFKKNGDFLMNYGKTLSMAGESNQAIIVLKQAKEYQNNTIVATALGDSYKATKQYHKAEEAYRQAIKMTPGKFYGYYLLVKLYDLSGQAGKTVALAEKILNKEIKIPSSAIEEMRDEVKKILIKYKKPLYSDN